MTQPATHAHRAAVILHDRLRDPESEPGALAPLRGEERLEDLREHVVRDPLARVADLDLHPLASNELRLDTGARLRRHGDGPALRHRIGGVQDEVEDHLLELVGGRPDLGQRGIEPIDHVDAALAQALRHQALGLFDKRVDVRRGHRLGLPVEAEHLAKDPRHPLGLASRDVDVLAARRGRRDLPLQEVERVLHRLERVVDLVCD